MIYRQSIIWKKPVSKGWSSPPYTINVSACYMRENIEVKLVGTRAFPRYVLVHKKNEYYIGPKEGWGPFHEALLFANLKRATTESLFLRDLAKLDRERRESERQRHERERRENEWRRLSGEEESEDDEDDTE
ncbi:MAG: hypothetical protein QF524_08030 [Planctomycetota bacterium]|jgi:hypothetical protein|nr:hypothetical protein [Planctomycetota bacterium]